VATSIFCSNILAIHICVVAYPMAANFNASLIPDHRSGLAGQIAKGAPWWRYAISRLYPSRQFWRYPRYRCAA
jgi:hypothetical protein